MAISGFGNTKNNLKLTIGGQAEKPKIAKIDAKLEPEKPTIKTNAVWIWNEAFLDDFSLTRPGDVMITDSGFAYRHCIDKDGNHSWEETIYVKTTDFESDRGDFRR